MATKCILLYLVILMCVNSGESIHCTMNMSTNECTCPSGYKNSNGTCEAECTLPCGKGTCFKPNQCKCFDGYKIDIKRLRIQTIEKLPICAPICKNCIGECVAPNNCILTPTTAPTTTTSLATTVIPTIPTIITPTTITTSTIAVTPATNTTVVTPTTTVTPATTTTVVIPTTTVTPATTTTPAAIVTITTVINSTTAVPATTATPIAIATIAVTPTKTISTTFVSSIGYEEESTTQLPTTVNHKFDYDTTTEQLVVAHTLDPTQLGRKATKQAMTAQDWLFLVISLVIASAIVVLLVWRKPIIRYFKGRSYAVEDNRPGRNRVQYSRTAQEEENKDGYC